MPRAKFSSRLTVRLAVVCVLALLVPGRDGHAQRSSAPASPAAAQPEAPQDSLGRTTPRGTVLGFLSAARKGENDLAREYLDTRLGPKQAAELAHELFVVLDARLPARLTQLSESPEGSRANPLTPNEDLVGRIESAQGSVDIFVKRVTRGTEGTIWLFSDKTLGAVPAVYEEVVASQSATTIGRLLNGTRLGGIRFLQWFTVLLGIAVFYFGIALLNRILTALIGRARARAPGTPQPEPRNVLPTPLRLLLLALVGQWVISNLSLSLFVRQFWSSAANLVTIAGTVWALILLNGEIEQYVYRRMPRTTSPAATSLLHVARRVGDGVVIFGGVLAVLRLFAIDATPALAGLGVGGIAVALAAQKTLENVVAGASLIFDQAVRVGDALTVGTVSGTVEHIGLRSTRIRTLDRTVVVIPNGQIANTSLETLSARDKFWFHHIVGLRYETSPDQLRKVVDGFRHLLREHPLVDPDSVRVRFIRLGAFSLDVDVFAYIQARDWNHFLEIQETLLFGLTECVTAAGTGIAFPSQTMYVENVASPQPAAEAASRT